MTISALHTDVVVYTGQDQGEGTALRMQMLQVPGLSRTPNLPMIASWCSCSIPSRSSNAWSTSSYRAAYSTMLS